jgi:hypothetical protein
MTSFEGAPGRRLLSIRRFAACSSLLSSATRVEILGGGTDADEYDIALWFDKSDGGVYFAMEGVDYRQLVW